METETQLSSKSIFHYTDKFQNLVEIINDGIRPRFNLEEFPFFDNIDTSILTI